MRAGSTKWSNGSIGAVRMIEKLHQTNPRFYNNFAEFGTNMMGLVRSDGAMDFYHGGLRATGADKNPFSISRLYPVQTDVAGGRQALELYEVPVHRILGPENGWYKVGPLARVQICDFIPSPEAESERKKMMAMGRAPGSWHALLPLGQADRAATRGRSHSRFAR